MSVDTNVKGRNLEPYARLGGADAEVLITRELTDMARTLHVDVSRGLRKKLVISFSNGL